MCICYILFDDKVFNFFFSIFQEPLRTDPVFAAELPVDTRATLLLPSHTPELEDIAFPQSVYAILEAAVILRFIESVFATEPFKLFVVKPVAL